MMMLPLLWTTFWYKAWLQPTWSGFSRFSVLKVITPSGFYLWLWTTVCGAPIQWGIISAMSLSICLTCLWFMALSLCFRVPGAWTKIKRGYYLFLRLLFSGFIRLSWIRLHGLRAGKNCLLFFSAFYAFDYLSGQDMAKTSCF